MSEKKYCPECNAPLEGNETFCDNCGARLREPTTDNTLKNEGTIATKGDTSDEDISRNNVMGSINKSTTNNSSNSVTNNNIDSSTNTSNIQSNSSSIDNSTVNNTTIVMGGKSEAEFCEVCGNPFEGKHARCPKCGKSICFDCKVKGKNRCVECEKKAINEYRMAYQELMLTTNGKIGAAGRQMMNRKAQELDVEDKKKSIEEEIDAMYKSETKAQQPEIIAAAAATAATATDGRRPIEQSSKSIGALSDQRPKLQPHNGGNSSDGSKKWFILGSVIAVILIAYIIFGGGNTQPTAPAPAEAAAPQEAPAAAPTPAAQPEPAAKPATTLQKTEAAPAASPAPKDDPLYNAGMKAYEEGNGLEAVKKFKASGSAEAYYMLGVIYESGCGGIGKNAMQARQNFKKAADMGHATAKTKL